MTSIDDLNTHRNAADDLDGVMTETYAGFLERLAQSAGHGASGAFLAASEIRRHMPRPARPARPAQRSRPRSSRTTRRRARRSIRRANARGGDSDGPAEESLDDNLSALLAFNDATAGRVRAQRTKGA